MNEPIYRVVREDGALVGCTGRGSDPFTRKTSAKQRASQLTTQARRYNRKAMGYKVQVAEPEWEDLDD